MLKKLLGGIAAIAFGLVIGLVGESIADSTSLLGVINIDNVPPTFTINGAYGANGVNNGTAGAALNTSQTTAPTATTCGTSPSVTGTDVDGTITTGTGSPTACTLNFTSTHTSVPNCTANTGSGVGEVRVSGATTAAVTFTLSATATAITYICLQ